MLDPLAQTEHAPASGDLLWLLVGGVLMNAIALVGGLTTLLHPARLERLLMPLVALAAGSLIGGAFFHIIPAATGAVPPLRSAGWVVAGFATFLALEQFLHWHHCHRSALSCRSPAGYLILLGDALHNLLGGIAVASAFLLDTRVGIASWLAAAAHEIPQELGDFGVLVHSGWDKRRALIWNVLSGATFPVGAVLAWLLSWQWNTAPLALFGAGIFVYVGASDLVPEIKTHGDLRSAAVCFGCFAASLALLFWLAIAFD